MIATMRVGYLVIVFLFSSVSLRAEQQSVTDFYAILLDDTSPSAEMESRYFGTTNADLAAVARSLPETRRSKTPVWDALRNRRELFAPTMGGSFVAERMRMSAPYSFSDMKSGKEYPQQFISVFFPSDLDDPSSKLKSVVFRLDEDGRLDISGTMIGGFTGDSILGVFTRNALETASGDKSAR